MSDTCSICGEPLLFDPESGEYVCKNGHVASEKAVDGKRYWIAGDLEDDMKKNHMGAPTRYSDPNPLSTMVGRRGKWGGEEVARLRAMQRIAASDPRIKKRTKVMELMEEAASKLNLPDTVVEEASRVYLKMERESDGAELRGKRLAPLAVALLYYVSRTYGVNRSLEEFLEAGNAWGVNEEGLRRSVRDYYLDIRGTVSEDQPMPSTKASVVSYLGKLASELKVNPRIEALARSIASQIDYGPLTGRNPKGIAAAILSISGNILNEDVRQAELSSASDVSSVTLRKRRKEIFDNYTIEVVPKLSDAPR